MVGDAIVGFCSFGSDCQEFAIEAIGKSMAGLRCWVKYDKKRQTEEAESQLEESNAEVCPRVVLGINPGCIASGAKLCWKSPEPIELRPEPPLTIGRQVMGLDDDVGHGGQWGLRHRVAS